MRNEMVKKAVNKLNDAALHAAKKSTVETACGWVLYQPKTPQELKKESEDKK